MNKWTATPGLGLDRSWLVDPAANRKFPIGLNTVEMLDSMKKVFPSKDRWVEATSQLMRQAGFDTVGAFGKEILPGFNRTPLLNFLGGFTHEKGLPPKSSGQLKLVHDKDFISYCQDKAREKCDPDDSSIIGYFLDNELTWNSTLINFKDYVRDYFDIIADAVNAADPGRMLLGCRFHRPTFDKNFVFRIAGKYCSVISINYYGVDKPVLSQTKNWTLESGRPYMISEAYAMANHGIVDGLTVTNAHGAGKVVWGQMNRAVWWNKFCLGAYADPNCVGINGWFRYADEPDQGGANKGIVGIEATPYADLITQMAITHAKRPI